jgi:hypothetical protein
MNGLVDMGTSMLIMLTSMVRMLSLMHRVTRIYSYKTTLGSSFKHWVASMKLLIKVDCEVHCDMTFMVVDMDSYDVLLGFHFFIKIKFVVDVEQGFI